MDFPFPFFLTNKPTQYQIRPNKTEIPSKDLSPELACKPNKTNKTVILACTQHYSQTTYCLPALHLLPLMLLVLLLLSYPPAGRNVAKRGRPSMVNAGGHRWWLVGQCLSIEREGYDRSIPFSMCSERLLLASSTSLVREAMASYNVEGDLHFLREGKRGRIRTSSFSFFLWIMLARALVIG